MKCEYCGTEYYKILDTLQCQKCGAPLKLKPERATYNPIPGWGTTRVDMYTSSGTQRFFNVATMNTSTPVIYPLAMGG